MKCETNLQYKIFKFSNNVVKYNLRKKLSTMLPCKILHFATVLRNHLSLDIDILFFFRHRCSRNIDLELPISSQLFNSIDNRRDRCEYRCGCREKPFAPVPKKPAVHVESSFVAIITWQEERSQATDFHTIL